VVPSDYNRRVHKLCVCLRHTETKKRDVIREKERETETGRLEVDSVDSLTGRIYQKANEASERVSATCPHV
jgi:hypothetical protein